MTQAVIFLLTVVGFIIGAILWYVSFNYSKSFVEWTSRQYYYYDGWQDYSVDLNSDGIFDDDCYYSESSRYIFVNRESDEGIRYDLVSENMSAKELIFNSQSTGKNLTVKFSQMEHYRDFISSKGWTDSGTVVVFYVFIGLAAFMGLYTFLQTLSAFLGKKSIKANNLSIVINSILFGYGTFGLVGGVKGRMYLQFTKFGGQYGIVQNTAPVDSVIAEECAADTQEPSELTKETDFEVSENKAVAAVTEEEEIPEYIQPKMGVKGKKAIMITLIISYSLLLIMGVLLAAVPAMSKIISGMGICEDISARAYGITIGVMWVALVPSFGYYFATVSPVEPSKKVRIIIAAVCAAISVAMVVIFFVIINAVQIEGIAAVKEFYEGSDSWFIPVSMVFAAVALMICHALTLFKINPAKIRNKKPEKCGDGFMSVLKYLFSFLLYGILGLVKFILTCKEKQPDIFILVSTILLTWLAHFVSFVFAIICIAILIAVVVMYFAGVIVWAYEPSQSGAESGSPTDDYYRKTAYTYTDSHGYEQTVYSDDEKNFYDAGGHYVGSAGEGGDFKKED